MTSQTVAPAPRRTAHTQRTGYTPQSPRIRYRLATFLALGRADSAARHGACYGCYPGLGLLFQNLRAALDQMFVGHVLIPWSERDVAIKVIKAASVLRLCLGLLLLGLRR